MSPDLETYLALLELEQTGADEFIGQHPAQTPPRTFGGQILAQAVIAAGRTISNGCPLHALHAHFVRGGNPKEPLTYLVTRHRDGKSFANRMITVMQNDEEIAVLLAAYQDWSAGLEHSVDVPLVAHPEELRSVIESLRGYEDKLQLFVNALKPIDMRYTNDPAWILKDAGERLNYNRVWMRADGKLPDDPLIHSATMAYSSDTTILDTIITTHGLSWGHDRIMAATVNHSMWFHRPIRFDDWSLYATESPVAAGSRGLATGRFFSLDGQLLATTAQEGVIKHFPRKGE